MALLCRTDTSCTMVRYARMKNNALCEKLPCGFELICYTCLGAYVVTCCLPREVSLEVDTWFQQALT